MRPARGYSLVELLCATAVAAVLASIVLPSYRSHVVRTQRAVAKAVLMEVASRQESYFSERKEYATTLSAWYPADARGAALVQRDGSTRADASGAIYRLQLHRDDAWHYRIEAEPINAQAGDTACGTLSYDSLGSRGASGTLGAGCWR